jgi:hypothetical protein
MLGIHFEKKNILGYILGDFFKNSSGHPVSDWKKIRMENFDWNVGYNF